MRVQLPGDGQQQGLSALKGHLVIWPPLGPARHFPPTHRYSCGCGQGWALQAYPECPLCPGTWALPAASFLSAGRWAAEPACSKAGGGRLAFGPGVG